VSLPTGGEEDKGYDASSRFPVSDSVPNHDGRVQGVIQEMGQFGCFGDRLSLSLECLVAPITHPARIPKAVEEPEDSTRNRDGETNLPVPMNKKLAQGWTFP
jgi:hypothetical protein